MLGQGQGLGSLGHRVLEILIQIKKFFVGRLQRLFIF